MLPLPVRDDRPHVDGLGCAKNSHSERGGGMLPLPVRDDRPRADGLGCAENNRSKRGGKQVQFGSTKDKKV